MVTPQPTQLDHIAISHRQGGSIEDCRSFQRTCLNSYHAMVRERLCILLDIEMPQQEKPLEFSLMMKKLRIYFTTN